MVVHLMALLAAVVVECRTEPFIQAASGLSIILQSASVLTWLSHQLSSIFLLTWQLAPGKIEPRFQQNSIQPLCHIVNKWGLEPYILVSYSYPYLACSILAVTSACQFTQHSHSFHRLTNHKSNVKQGKGISKKQMLDW